MTLFRVLMSAGVVATLAPTAPAMAYGRDGHRIVCDLAYRFLQPEARAEVDRLVALDTQFDHFRDVCSWADQVRSSTHLRTAPYHYTGQDRDDPIVDPEDCAFNGCIMSAINLHARELVDESNSDAEKLEALKFLAHWIGDIHQPLHVSINGDRGGNDIPVIWRGERHTNLHRVWDSEIILDYMGETWPWVEERSRWSYFADELAAEIPLSGSEIYTTVDPFAWAQESHNIVRSRDFGYYWANADNTIEPGDAYYQRGLRTSRQQIKLAGVRLAGVLNGLLDSPADGVGGFETAID